jgi:hypothetical protein
VPGRQDKRTPGEGAGIVTADLQRRQRTPGPGNGDPGEDFTPCLRWALGTASHELCHVLAMRHCTAFRCLMNGSNHQGGGMPGRCTKGMTS